MQIVLNPELVSQSHHGHQTMGWRSLCANVIIITSFHVETLWSTNHIPFDSDFYREAYLQFFECLTGKHISLHMQFSAG